jgi:hypothetical protein
MLTFVINLGKAGGMANTIEWMPSQQGAQYCQKNHFSILFWGEFPFLKCQVFSSIYAIKLVL